MLSAQTFSRRARRAAAKLRLNKGEEPQTFIAANALAAPEPMPVLQGKRRMAHASRALYRAAG